MKSSKRTNSFVFKDKTGMISGRLKTDLAEEECSGYLPDGYSYDKVVELEEIKVFSAGRGYGSVLMKRFLESPLVRDAQLVFLDPNPYERPESMVAMDEDGYLKFLKEFYGKFGFRCRDGDNRMWFVVNGDLSLDELPHLREIPDEQRQGLDR